MTLQIFSKRALFSVGMPPNKKKMLTHTDRAAHRALCDAFYHGTDAVWALTNACGRARRCMPSSSLAAESGTQCWSTTFSAPPRRRHIERVGADARTPRADAVLDVVAAHARMHAETVTLCAERRRRRGRARAPVVRCAHRLVRAPPNGAASRLGDAALSAFADRVPSALKATFRMRKCTKLHPRRDDLVKRMRNDVPTDGGARAYPTSEGHPLP